MNPVRSLHLQRSHELQHAPGVVCYCCNIELFAHSRYSRLENMVVRLKKKCHRGIKKRQLWVTVDGKMAVSPYAWCAWRVGDWASVPFRKRKCNGITPRTTARYMGQWGRARNQSLALTLQHPGRGQQVQINKQHRLGCRRMESREPEAASWFLLPRVFLPARSLICSQKVSHPR